MITTHLNTGLFGGWGNGKIVDLSVCPLLAFFNEHDGDIVSDGVLSIAIGFLTHEPCVVHKLQTAGVVARLPGLTTDAVGAAQNV
jgi:hypothetical protein